MEQTNNLSISTNDAFKAVCRYWDRIVRPEQLMSAMISAFRVLTDPANTGAVCIAMPQDVEGEAYDYPESFFKKRVWRLERRPATEAALADAAEVIKKAKRPILVAVAASVTLRPTRSSGPSQRPPASPSAKPRPARAPSSGPTP